MDAALKRMKELKIETSSVLTAVKQRLHETLRDNMRQIILFGSRSRGDEERDSDYDILLLVDERTRALEDQVDDIAYEMLDRYGAVVTIFVFGVETFKREIHEPLFCNIRREGVAL